MNFKKIAYSVGASVLSAGLLFVNFAHAAVTQWNTSDTESVVTTTVTSMHDNVIYLAQTIGPYAIALGIAFLIWRWFQHKAHNPG